MEKSTANKGKAPASPKGAQDSQHHKPSRKKSLSTVDRLFKFGSKSSRKEQEAHLDPQLSCRGNSEYGSVVQIPPSHHRHQHSSGHLGRSGPPKPYRHLPQPCQEGFGLASYDDDDIYCSDGGEEEQQKEPDATLLGSVDYHNFLGGSSGRRTKFTWSPSAITLPSTFTYSPTPKRSVGFIADSNATHHDPSTPQTAIKPQPSRESSIPGPIYQTPLQTLRSKQYLSLQERRSQRLTTQFASPDPQLTPTRGHHDQPSLSSLGSGESVTQSLRRHKSQSHSHSQSQRLAEQVAFLGTPRAGRNNSLSFLTQTLTTQPLKNPTLTSAAVAASWPSRPPTPSPSPYPVPIPPIPSAYSTAPYSRPSASSPRTPTSTRCRVPIDTVSWKDVDPEKRKPFTGPLPAQQSPPQKPLPEPPRPFVSNTLFFDFDFDHNMPKDKKGKGKAEESFSLPSPSQDPFNINSPSSTKQRLFSLASKGKSSIDTDEGPERMSDNKSDKAIHHELRNKVSKLFGDERLSRDTGTTSTLAPISTYRPISLNSHDSERISFSDLFKDVFNAGRLSTGSGRPSQESATGDVSRASSAILGGMHDVGSTSFDSGRPSGSSPAQIGAIASNHVGRGSIAALSREITGGTSPRGPHDSSGISLDLARPSVSGGAAQMLALASIESGRASMASTSEDARAGRRPSQARRESISPQPAPSRDEIAQALANRLGLSDERSRKAILEAFSAIAPHPLTQHPALRGDLPLQARSELLDFSDKHAAVTIHLPRGTLANYATRNQTAGLHVPPLNVHRQRPSAQAQPGRRPTQVAVSTRNVTRSTPPVIDPLTGFLSRALATVPDVTEGKDPEMDVDIDHPFDRTVDVTWYRFAERESETSRVSFLPHVDSMFFHVTSAFTARLFRGRMTSKYDHMRRRFPYFRFDADIRFKIMEKLLENYLPGKPILLNRRQAIIDAWPADEFATFRDVLGPLQNYLVACPRLRADVMVALFMRQPFHVVFDPFTKGETTPLATKWLFKYLYYMQDVRVELDLTKLGFGPHWEATSLSTRLWDVGNLVHVFVEEMLQRDARENPMGQLTIFCRRYFGYRQGKNPFEHDKSFYKDIPVGGEDERKPPSHIDGQPWNYNIASTSLPPSANNPYSGHRRHHAAGPGRVPYAHEDHMTIANAFPLLVGRVWSVRMCGLSENWVRDNHAKFWPEDEFAAIADKSIHIDRYTPSKHKHAAEGHSVYLDYGIRIGIHRFPPLRDSEQMVCIPYDLDQDCFVEVGSGNILTVYENGVEFIARATQPPLPRSNLPRPGGPAVPLSGVRGLAPRSRIPSPVGRAMTPVMRAMRESTPHKAYKLLGLGSGSAGTVTPRGSAEDSGESLVTPTRPRVSTAASVQRQVSNDVMEAVEDQLGELVGQQSGSTTVNDGARTRVLSTKKSFLSIMGGERRKPNK